MNAANGNRTESAGTPALEVADVSVTYRTKRRTVEAVRHVSFRADAGSVLAIVGESGSGKSTIVNALLGLLPQGTDVEGRFLLEGRDMTHADERDWLSVRGGLIGFVPQDPQSSLDPTMRIGDQIAEIVRLHRGREAGDVRAESLRLLAEVGIDDPGLRARQYPHELSGGLKQRVLIAQALAGDPRIIVADEPTSALDVTVQKVVLDLLASLVRRRGITLVMITHDLAVAADRADRILVMLHGEAIEQNDTATLLAHPSRDYTRRLLALVPKIDNGNGGDGAMADGASATDGNDGDDERTAVSWLDVTREYRAAVSERAPHGVLTAVDHVSLKAYRGRTLAIVGESGSGKSTLLSMALALNKPTSGAVRVLGDDLGALRGRALRQARRNFQLVQQNPFDSLDPSLTVRQSIEEPLRAFGYGTAARREVRVRELVDRVALPQTVLKARPGELSGGQSQRVAIARALAVEPQLVFLDEPVSALDVSVQDQILRLLAGLQRDLGLTYVFVSHNLAVVSEIADDVAVMCRGRLVEYGTVERVLRHPAEAYTRQLLDAIPGRG
ncbi:dipeptide ABC transporter ATP-binding protein [Bifidobacterium avesanii]|uniref:Dipeptide ABC transporter ATP-binding protein n=1 Tax=Bifidobacterium avesanii TaxID=1798157 RepID=A0A7K3TG53_9BIFI|nr:ABC transporter ATP-binding protein [Bifidobacterium avesanii]KAB8291462.1 ABC transporter ATP-binding protein [Bifidobacterium avesanii]NEG77906.1 dipeptide ABC transporter ATP-binding protein [Bifidobacterium avesanii]